MTSYMLIFLQVSVRVLDTNDNPPAFRFPSYPVTVSESTAPNSIFLSIFASDADLGSNADITYSIVAGNTSGELMYLYITD